MRKDREAAEDVAGRLLAQRESEAERLRSSVEASTRALRKAADRRRRPAARSPPFSPPSATSCGPHCTSSSATPGCCGPRAGCRRALQARPGREERTQSAGAGRRAARSAAATASRPSCSSSRSRCRGCSPISRRAAASWRPRQATACWSRWATACRTSSVPTSPSSPGRCRTSSAMPASSRRTARSAVDRGRGGPRRWRPLVRAAVLRGGHGHRPRPRGSGQGFRALRPRVHRPRPARHRLGLAIAGGSPRDGWRDSVESAPGQGSRFSLALRLHGGGRPRLAAAPARALPIVWHRGPLRRILVDQDSEENRRYLVDLLSGWGLEVREATGAPRARALPGRRAGRSAHARHGRLGLPSGRCGNPTTCTSAGRPRIRRASRSARRFPRRLPLRPGLSEAPRPRRPRRVAAASGSAWSGCAGTRQTPAQI